MRKLLFAPLFLLMLPLQAQEKNALRPVTQLIELNRDSTLTRKEKWRESRNIFVRFIRAFDEYDTCYIEPNRYKWTAMMQGTTTYENLIIRDEGSQSKLSFSSKPGMAVGPYIGWGPIFLGYTVDVTTLGKEKRNKTELELSLYSNMLGADLFYRRTGSDFSLKRGSSIGNEIDMTPYYNKEIKGIRLSTTGVNAYYIVNHKHFSLPAAFSQSTVQRISSGSWKFGLSITKHSLKFDLNEVAKVIPELKENNPFKSADMKYMDYSISAGYAYNWVFAHNWLLSIDMAPSIAYKRTHRSLWYDEDAKTQFPIATEFIQREFVSRGNINFDLTGRFGIVWNNAHHYAGMSIVAHNFNYHYKDLSMHNTFFTLNLYAGLNFIRKKG